MVAPLATRYAAMLDALFGARRLGVKLALDRMHMALDALGHPERHLGTVVHIGGTNGKGSCAAFVDAMARAAGLRVGLFTSPHLVDFAERFRVQGENVDQVALLEAYERVQAVLGPDHGLTFFEVITAMGLALFARAGLDLCILEVGLGGRLDATNVVRGDVACVTGVALDHEDYLGSDLAGIAAEKAGIFKPGQRAVIGRSGEPQAVDALIAHARRAGVAELTVVRAPVAEDVRLGLGGAHQRDNAAAALAIVAHLVAMGVLPADRDHIDALAHTRHPGRLERIDPEPGQRGPRVVLDGAHNPHGAAALAREMEHMARPRVLVLGSSLDKDVMSMAGILGAQAEDVVLTQAENPRATPAAELGARVAGLGCAARVAIEPDLARALERARHAAGASGTVVIAGSLFLVGDARRLLLGLPRSPGARLSDPVGRAP